MSTLRFIVLCGGSGTRIWPLSRDMYPLSIIQIFPRPIRYASALEVSAAAFPKEYSALLAVPDLAISKSSRVPDGALGYQPEPPFSNVPVSEVRRCV